MDVVYVIEKTFDLTGNSEIIDTAFKIKSYAEKHVIKLAEEFIDLAKNQSREFKKEICSNGDVYVYEGDIDDENNIIVWFFIHTINIK